jgi:hypothetical protein
MKIASAMVVLVGVCGAASAECRLDKVIGYTLLEKTSVRATFEGCEHDRLIEFDNGTTLRCAEYSYHYAYRPDSYIFAKKIAYSGRDWIDVKVCIDGEFFDMRPR